MKKLLVVLAVLFATVGSMYAAGTGTGTSTDPATDQATVKVDVVCPLSVSHDKDLAFRVIRGTTRTLSENNEIAFDINGCVNGQGTATTYSTYSGATLTISYAAAPTTNTQDNEVKIKGQVKVNAGAYSAEEEMGNVALVTDVAHNVPFNGNIHIVGKVNSITASATASLATQYSWTFTVSAFYDNL